MISSSRNRLNEAAMDVAAVKHRAIISNTANIDTPHYKRKYVAFEEELAKVLKGQSSELEGKRTDPRHINIGMQQGRPVIHTRTSLHTTMNNNGNNVDIDYEMTELAKNQLYYNILADRVSGHYKKMDWLLKNLK
jgi:flagellar basal-body rod protein FlgB